MQVLLPSVRWLPLCVVASSLNAAAQTTFSIDFRGPTIGVPSPTPITGADILMPTTPGAMPTFAPWPAGTLLPPSIVIPGGPAGVAGLGLPAYAGCVGVPPGIPCGAEVDALSYALDGPLMPVGPAGRIFFSVGRTALGIPGMAPPSVATEMGMPPAQAAGDVFVDLGLPAGPLPPFAVPPANTGFIDGNGIRPASPFVRPGLGLIEPHGPPCVAPASPGDNLDALDVDGPIGVPYFSVEGVGFNLCGFPRSGASAANGILPGAVVTPIAGGGPIVVYALPGALGLDLFGPGTDDLDGLALYENGIAAYQPSPGPYAWFPMAPPDMLLFSVSATSAVIGAPDSIFGIPIAPGDILIPPVAGGVSPFPGILIAAENLGLGTVRSGFVLNDELDALDVTRVPQRDCNGNGVEDVVDIAFGAPDCSSDGILDACENNTVSYCTAATTTNGCTATMTSSGVPSVSSTCPFTITTTGIEGQKLSLFFYGVSGAASAPWGTGFLCVKAPVQRTPAANSGGTAGACDGTLSISLPGYLATHPFALGTPLYVSERFWFQTWFRDPPSPKTTNLSDAITFTLAP